jgi:hypothetical protein
MTAIFHSSADTWRSRTDSFRLRRLVASALRQASRWLARHAYRMQVADAARAAQLANESTLSGALEFYAEAGAPDGALYVNGKLIGYLEGVTRL